VHFGLFEGLTADEIRERYPDHFSVWNADRLAPDYTYPGARVAPILPRAWSAGWIACSRFWTAWH